MNDDRNAAELRMLLLAEGARRYEAESRLAGARARIDQLEAALTDERTYSASLEHALAGLSWTLAEGGDPS